MLNILTLKVGTKYSADYCNILYSSLKRHSDVDFNFICYTEDASGLMKNIQVVDVPDVDAYQLQWHKMMFHKSGFAGISEGDKCLTLDIDWIITNDMTPILQYELPDNTFGCFERWWSNKRHFCKLNGGFQMYYMGQTNYLWQEFSKQPYYWQRYYIENGFAEGPVNGEQNFIDQHAKNKHWLPMEWFAKYHKEDLIKIQKNWDADVNSDEPYMLAGEFCESIKMVHFSNANNLIHNSDDDWVFDYWYSDYDIGDNFIYE